MDWEKELYKYLLKDEEISADSAAEWCKLSLTNIDKLLKILYDALEFDHNYYKEKEVIRGNYTASLAKLILAMAVDKGEQGIQYIFEQMMKDPFERTCPFSDKEQNQLYIMRYIVEDKNIYEVFKNMILKAEKSIQNYIMILLEDGDGNLDVSHAKDEITYILEFREGIHNLNLSGDEVIADDDQLYEVIDKWYNEDKDYYIVDMLNMIPEKRWNWNLAQKYISACNNTHRYNKAIECLFKFKDDVEKHSSYWHYLYAFTLLMKNKKEEAISELECSLKINPKEKCSKNLLDGIHKEEQQSKEKKIKKVKRKKIEIKYNSEEDKYYLAKGAFDLGYLGCYEAEKIKIEITKYEDDDEYKQIIDSNLKPNQIAKRLSEYYNERQKNLLENQKEVNNAFLDYLFEGILACEYPFWEGEDGNLEEFIIKNRMPKNTESIFAKEKVTEMNKVFGSYYEMPNNGTIPDKADIQEMIKKYFPMISMKKLVDSIEPEYLVFCGSVITFQCSSDVCDGMLICAAYAEINKDNSFYDWHNH